MSSESNTHTPGPWNVHRKADDPPSALPWIAGHMGRPLAFVIHESIARPDLERANANARLIASAPELLAALKVVAGSDNWRCSVDEEWDVVNVAISKAEGRTPSKTANPGDVNEQ